MWQSYESQMHNRDTQKKKNGEQTLTHAALHGSKLCQEAAVH